MYQNRIPLLENICKKYSLDEKLFITLQMAIQNSMASKKQQNKNQIEVVGKSNSQELVAKCDQFNVLSVGQTIFTFRGIQVIIDRDLAQLYGVETKQLNQQVRRNIERFPLSFRFQLTKEEKDELVTNCDRFNSLKHSTVNPYAFTEQGVAMLSAVLKSDTAIKVSIQIMQAFVAMRRYISAQCGYLSTR
jgi:3-dehydroquinate dehydratase